MSYVVDQYLCNQGQITHIQCNSGALVFMSVLCRASASDHQINVPPEIQCLVVYYQQMCLSNQFDCFVVGLVCASRTTLRTSIGNIRNHPRQIRLSTNAVRVLVHVRGVSSGPGISLLRCFPICTDDRADDSLGNHKYRRNTDG